MVLRFARYPIAAAMNRGRDNLGSGRVSVPLSFLSNQLCALTSTALIQQYWHNDHQKNLDEKIHRRKKMVNQKFKLITGIITTKYNRLVVDTNKFCESLKLLCYLIFYIREKIGL